MGIYIKGMDFLPEDGTEFVVKKDEYGTWIKPIGHMGFSMRLIELPENHGDLIDRDALLDMVRDVNTDYFCEVLGVTVEDIDSAHTVIEAEGR